MNDLQKPAPISQDEKVHESIFWQHEKQQHYKPYLRNVSWTNTHQSEYPNGTRTWPH
jgi:hypothetical protein